MKEENFYIISFLLWEGTENFLQYLLSYCVLTSVINTLDANFYSKKAEVAGHVAKAESPQ